MEEKTNESRIKLNLQNVTELISDTHHEWREGDFVIIESQTGTGKTHFVRMELIKSLSFDSILYLCNRKNLERQVKSDLLAMRNEEIPSNDELDKIDKIGNTTIKTYQAVQAKIQNDEYFKNAYTKEYEYYDYIILDECHYIFSDSSFNNTTRLIFDEYILNSDLGTIKIFMTATADEIKKPILEYIESIKERVKRIPYVSGGYRGEFEPKIYSSGIDYRYVNAKYFKHIEDITTTIQNDTSEDKWIVFVSNIAKSGQPMKEALGQNAVLITKDTEPDNPELISIIRDRAFKKKVLITTSTLDNGISIEDEKVKHIVIMAWDKVTFIQMLGRRRVKIKNADIVNLYMPLRNGNGFHTRIYGDKGYAEKLEDVKLCKENPTAFARKYDTNHKDIFDELFHIDKETRNWTVNPIGEWRVRADKEFAEHMLKQFKDKGRFAFVQEQLSWIGLEGTFDEKKLIENVIPNKEREELENYLSSLVGAILCEIKSEEDRERLIEKIKKYGDGKSLEDKELLIVRINAVVNKKGRPIRGRRNLNEKLEEIESQYSIGEYKKDTTDAGKRIKIAGWTIEQRKADHPVFVVK